MTSRTQQAIDWLQAAPGRTQQEAAALYGIRQASISAGLARRRAAIMRTDTQVRHLERIDAAARRERLQCAILAEQHGAPHVAAAILKRG